MECRRRSNRITHELDELTAAAGGWHSHIPAADKAEWMAVTNTAGTTPD